MGAVPVSETKDVNSESENEDEYQCLSPNLFTVRIRRKPELGLSQQPSQMTPKTPS